MDLEHFVELARDTFRLQVELPADLEEPGALIRVCVNAAGTTLGISHADVHQLDDDEAADLLEVFALSERGPDA